MADAKRSTGSAGIAVRELGGADAEYCTVYSGTMAQLVAAGVATAAQFPTGLNGANKWTMSGGYKGSGKNQGQRWKVRRLRRDLFEVHRYHEPRRLEPAFQRQSEQEPGDETTAVFKVGEWAAFSCPGSDWHLARVEVVVPYGPQDYRDDDGVVTTRWGYVVRFEGEKNTYFASAANLREYAHKPAHLRLVRVSPDEVPSA